MTNYITMLLRDFKGKLIFFIGLCLAHSAQAQFADRERYWELGLSVGATNYSGDLAGEHITLAHTKMSAGIFARLHLSNTFQVRGQFFYGQIGGDDKNSPTLAGRQFRFKSTLLEGAALLETTIATFEYEPVSSDATIYFSPYVFGGVGGVNVQADVTYYGPESDRDRFVIEPLPEGGTSNHFLLTTPFGLGLRMVSGRFSIGFEACARPVFNDLLDGVSLNGNPTKNDWYHSLGLTFSYSLGQHSQDML